VDNRNNTILKGECVMAENWTKEKQNKAEQLGVEMVEQIYSIMSKLPKKLEKENVGMFANACEQISKITTHAFSEAEKRGIRDIFSGWRKILIPFWKFGNIWESAYGTGFTWEQFLETILEEGCTEVSLSKDKKHPEILFQKNNKTEFTITIVDED
jgi:hypothetical protein